MRLIRTLPAYSIRDSGIAAQKVRMYGCNPYLLAVMQLTAWQTGGDHVCVKTLSAVFVQRIFGHVGVITDDLKPSNPPKTNVRGDRFTFSHSLDPKWPSP